MSPVTQGLNAGRPGLTLAGARRVDLESDLIQLEIVEAPGQPFSCRARFSNLGADPRGRTTHKYFGDQRPDLGAELVVEVNYRGTDLTIFRGNLKALGARYPKGRPPEIEVAAEDPLQRLRMHQRSRKFEDLTDAAVISGVAAEYGLTPDLSTDGETHSVIVQLQQTDLDFVRERARMIGAEIWVRDGRLVVRGRGQSPDPEVELELGEELLSFEVEGNLEDQVTSLRTHGWDYSQKEAAVGATGAGALLGPLSPDIDGGAVHQAVLGERGVQSVRSGPTSVSQAEGLARAYYVERTRGFVRGFGTGDGLPQIRLGRRLNLAGLGEFFDGSYDVVRVRHEFNAQAGYRTDFNVERQGLPLKPERRRERPR